MDRGATSRRRLVRRFLHASARARNRQAARTVLDEARASEAADIECFNSAFSAVARGQGWKLRSHCLERRKWPGRSRCNRRSRRSREASERRPAARAPQAFERAGAASCQAPLGTIGFRLPTARLRLRRPSGARSEEETCARHRRHATVSSASFAFPEGGTPSRARIGRVLRVARAPRCESRRLLSLSRLCGCAEIVVKTVSISYYIATEIAYRYTSSHIYIIRRFTIFYIVRRLRTGRLTDETPWLPNKEMTNYIT